MTLYASEEWSGMWIIYVFDVSEKKLYSVHLLYCAFQWSPSQYWLARWILIPFSPADTRIIGICIQFLRRWSLTSFLDIFGNFTVFKKVNIFLKVVLFQIESLEADLLVLTTLNRVYYYFTPLCLLYILDPFTPRKKGGYLLIFGSHAAYLYTLTWQGFQIFRFFAHFFFESAIMVNNTFLGSYNFSMCVGNSCVLLW